MTHVFCHHWQFFYGLSSQKQYTIPPSNRRDLQTKPVVPTQPIPSNGLSKDLHGFRGMVLGCIEVFHLQPGGSVDLFAAFFGVTPCSTQHGHEQIYPFVHPCFLLYLDIFGIFFWGGGHSKKSVPRAPRLEFSQKFGSFGQAQHLISELKKGCNSRTKSNGSGKWTRNTVYHLVKSFYITPRSTKSHGTSLFIS